MTAKEKAKELVERYERHLVCPTIYGSPKGCALIAVDEIISFCNYCPVLNKGKDTDVIWGFWQEVKQEIEKL